LNERIEKANEELKIEASLERVRTVAMSMTKPDDLLSICKILFTELEVLGIKELRNAMINIYNDEKNTFLNYDFSGSLEQSITVFSMIHSHPVPDYITKQIRQGKSHFAEIALTGEQLADWIEFREKNGELPDPKLKSASTLCYYFYSVGTAAIGISTLSSVTKEEHEILMRFRNVFDLAYKRYTDIKQAEAQAKEAKIEAALERVRATSMAMHHSNDLVRVINIVKEQLSGLGFHFHGANFVTDYNEHGYTMWLASPGESFPYKIYVPQIGQKFFEAVKAAIEKGSDFATYTLNFEEKNIYFKNLFENSLAKNTSEEGKRKAYESKGMAASVVLLDKVRLNLMNLDLVPYTDEENNILRRFGYVFEQSYTRFLDLQKAEAQAKEAQIEAALERVRSRSMAMHKSDELREVVAVLFAQLQHIGFDIKFCSIALINKVNSTVEFWLSGFSQEILPESYHVPNLDHPFYQNFQNTFRQGTSYKVFELAGEEKRSYDKLWFALTDFKNLPAPVKKPMMEMERVVLSCAFTKNGMIQIGGFEPLSDTDASVIQRFAKVFEQTHTRFLDLQKAEAQAREAQIELGLEKVRAKAMAMHKSDDLKTAVETVFEELDKLNIGILRCGIAIMDKEKPRADVWITVKSEPKNTVQVSGDEPLDYHPLLRGAYDGWIKQEDFSYVLQGEDLLSYYRDVANMKYQLPVSTPFDKEKIDQQQYYFNAVFQDGSLFAFMDMPFTDEAKTVMKRFANVFNLTYKRFLDLQKAEAQAREAQIELGLERVRARAMAMQKSDELKELIATVSTELSKLDIILDRCFIMIYDIKTLGVTWWMANPETSSDPIGLYVKYHEQVPYLAFLKAWQDRVLKWQFILEGSVKKTWDEFLFVETELSQLPRFVIDNMRANDKVYLSASFNNFGCLTLATLEPLSDEQFDIMLRFAKVFDLTYTRFNDLKQAEAQAREARIETALEKVRASTMAMQRSEDLSQTAFVLFNQFKELGEAPERIFIATFDDHDNGVVDLWGTGQGGNQLNKLFKLPVNEPTMVSKIVAAWKEKRRSVVVDLKGEELKAFLGSLKKAGIPVTEGIMTDRRVQTAACFSSGVIGVTTAEPQSAEAVQLQERFAGVFDLTYTRFLDLQKAEAQAREAKIETALERVRARALAMQEPEELKDVAQVLRTEMGLLGVEELETCSIYINDESAEKAECWYALKDTKSEEKKLVNDHFALNLNDTWVGREMLQFYQSPKKQISIIMQGDNRKEWIRYCEENSAPLRGYYGEVIPDRTYHLYKFSHGAIGAASAGDISEESWRMLNRAASVFSLAYSRFKDLTQARTDLIKLKEEKKRAEEALTELQATQKQLIQSEKMASLGELTAGIAHEIQNPLNFVNNFSDVSNELLEEMKAELEKGNAEDAKAIAISVKENLEKILHHGKRADAIVKGMLQHSRSSSGQKELTDINVLAEEYLRLAYHGLRAKDKFFNAKFETDLDPSINKINVVPQEIGRVILNLINNSFYAVSEKKRHISNGYEPSVTVSTKKINDKVEIRVMDNGNGILQKDLDKIFQPFFTTKPTGQGTGLGLSLSYDIVTKGHDGEIKVETKEGEGSAFIISLPMK
ncbi:MAG TPA: ATP-binding protein, partial [Chitinophagaceae bacterium]|nr:ATP-binding protein [Chitinophagaceae bacterium]